MRGFSQSVASVNGKPDSESQAKRFAVGRIWQTIGGYVQIVQAPPTLTDN